MGLCLIGFLFDCDSNMSSTGLTDKRNRTAPEDGGNTDNNDKDKELKLDNEETELYQLSEAAA